VALLIFSITHNVQAEVSISAHISTVGPGIDVSYKFNPSFGIRAGWQQFETDFDFKPEDENGIPGDELNYAGDLKLANGSLLADWYLGQATFRLTAGILLNNSSTKLTTNCQTNSDDLLASNDCEVGGASAPGSDIGELRITIDFEENIAPYIGIGWAFQPDKHWHINADLGVAYLAKANADIQSSGSCNNTSACRAQLDDEERELENDMQSLEFFPVAKLGLGYRF
jgi:hypothetical protein